MSILIVIVAFVFGATIGLYLVFVHYGDFSEKHTSHELYKFAIEIHEYCKSQENCKHCKFNNRTRYLYDDRCELVDIPKFWFPLEQNDGVSDRVKRKIRDFGISKR